MGWFSKTVKKFRKNVIPYTAPFLDPKSSMEAYKGHFDDISGKTAAEKAANAQEQAARDGYAAISAATDRATAEQRRQYDQSREDLAPWRDAGKNALNQLVDKINAGPGEYTQSPGYQFRLEQGNKNILRQHGNYRSGATDKALIQFGQNYATNDYDNFLNRYYKSLQPLHALSEAGRGATTTTVAAGNNATNAITNNILADGQAKARSISEVGNARASKYINKYNSVANILSQGAGLAAMTYGGKGWGAGKNNILAGGQ